MAKTPARGPGAPRKTKIAAPVERVRTAYGRKSVRRICQLVESGLTLTDVGKSAEGPSYSTIYNWMQKYPAFREAVAAARERGAAALTDEVLDIARGLTADNLTVDKAKMQGVQWAAGKASPQRQAAVRAGRQPAEPTEVTLRVRRFQKLFDAEGQPYLREIFPEGEG